MRKSCESPEKALRHSTLLKLQTCLFLSLRLEVSLFSQWPGWHQDHDNYWKAKAMVKKKLPLARPTFIKNLLCHNMLLNWANYIFCIINLEKFILFCFCYIIPCKVIPAIRLIRVWHPVSSSQLSFSSSSSQISIVISNSICKSETRWKFTKEILE